MKKTLTDAGGSGKSLDRRRLTDIVQSSTIYDSFDVRHGNIKPSITTAITLLRLKIFSTINSLSIEFEGPLHHYV